MTDPLPRYAVIPGLGKCRVLSYEGDGYFRVLRPKTDSSYRIPRNRITFTNK